MAGSSTATGGGDVLRQESVTRECVFRVFSGSVLKINCEAGGDVTGRLTLVPRLFRVFRCQEIAIDGTTEHAEDTEKKTDRRVLDHEL